MNSLTQHSKHSFQYGNTTFDYELIRSKRRKTCEIIVDKTKVTVRAPYDKTSYDIEKIIHEKIKWISQKQREMIGQQTEIIKPNFENNSTLPFLGKNYRLVLEYIIQEEKLEFKNGKFIVYLNHNNTSQKEIVKKLYVKWLFLTTNDVSEERVKICSKIIDIYPKKIKLKNLKGRWGSFSKDATLSLNVHLVKAPIDVIDYVILHELCHFKIKGHSFRFWTYLKQFVPDYEQKKKWLERNTSNLLSS